MRILVPTDFSECAENAAHAAMLLAAKLNASIHFLHILAATDRLSHVPHNLQAESSQDPSTGYAQNQLNLLESKASQLGLTANHVLVFDRGNEHIENYITSLGIDLVVMGSHGATGIRELVIGSNTQRLVRNSTVPVLVIKHPIMEKLNIESIVFASTFNHEISAPFKAVVDIARSLKASVHILFINFIDKLADKEMIDGIIKKLIQPFPDVLFTTNSAEANDEEFGIHQFVEMIDADMVAITTHDKTGFLFRHSVAESLVNHEIIPILIIK